MSERRVAIVTGGARGIGLAVARALARDGCVVVIGDLDGDAGRAAAEAIVAEGGRALFHRTDVTAATEATGLVELTVREFGRLDCAVNNAGINLPPAPMAEIDDEAWDRLFAINVAGVRNCMRAEIAPMRRAGRGAIVNMASTLGIVGGRNCAPYVASKHAVVGLTRAAALDYARAGIRINAVCPGPVETRMMDVALSGSAAAVAELLAAMPSGRFVEADEVAAAVVWLSSPAGAGVFGQCLTVDGAWTAV
jgi:NAD(P)-dependent dehydrogenase (short-subunit alcohol dehydrogenase family)